MNVSFEKEISKEESKVIVVPVANGNNWGLRSRNLNMEFGCALSGRIEGKPSFEGKTGQVLTGTVATTNGFKDIIFLGIGNPEALEQKSFKGLGSTLFKALKQTGETENISLISDDYEGSSLSQEEFAAYLIDGVHNATYSFDKYKTAAKSDALSLTAVVNDTEKAKQIYTPLQTTTESVSWAKDLGNEPANKLTPVEYAKRITDELQAFPNLKVRTLDVADLKQHGMGGALAVMQGSTMNPGCMVVMEYNVSSHDTERPLGLVGKGVTFDSGGLNLKPGGSMLGMKMDMCGSAAVVGAMRSLAARGSDAKVVAIVGLTENMPDGHSYRPSDILKMMNGKTVEIGNTDAEGRLVLADAMTYLQQKYNPETMVDLATLTGAVVMALSHTYTGVFDNDDELWERIQKAGKIVDEEGWRMPTLHADFAKAMRGKLADFSNVSSIKGAGASTAAAFLHNFIEKDENGQDKCRWAHMDIAGTATPPGGMASGVGVRWLDRFVRDNYEGKSKSPYLNSAPKVA